MGAVALICAVLIAAAYGNSLQNAFALDDSHSIVNNPWVRSLANIPRYFADPMTFTTLKANADYRPLLQVTYAINYAISGYDVWSWHAVNLLMHLCAAVSVFAVGRRLIGTMAARPLPWLAPHLGNWASLGAAATFAVHPITSGCCNYISARSSLMVAALLLPALALYLRAMSRDRPGPVWIPMIGALALYLGALLTKVEAVSFAAVVVLAQVLLAPASRGESTWRGLFQWRMWAAPVCFLVLTVAYLVLWKAISPLQQSTTRAAPGVTPAVYLMTQWSAWWHYVGIVFAPLNLIADDLTYPVTRSIWGVRPLLALGEWLVVGAILLACVRRAPAITLLGAAFFLFLAPHSSIVPLAEMVNEHRPYLPVAGLFILIWAIAFSAIAHCALRPRLAGMVLAAAMIAPLIVLTRARNEVWRDDLTLWQDTAEKTPGASRAQMNYGLALMRRARFAEAEARLRRAVALAPNYDFGRTNLAIVLDAQGDRAGAAKEHDEAVRLGPDSNVPYYWRGRFSARHAEFDSALADFHAAVQRSGAPAPELAAIVETLIRAGRPAEIEPFVARGVSLAGTSFDLERAQFRTEVFGTRQAHAEMTAGLDLMKQGKMVQAEERFRAALSFDPSYHYAMTNLGIALAGQGRTAEALDAHARAIALAPRHSSPYYWRGLYWAKQGEAEKAAADFQVACNFAGESVTELAALAEALVRAGRAGEAEPVIGRGMGIDAPGFQRERANIAAMFGRGK